MSNAFILLFLSINLLFTQDRSLIYTTGAPLGSCTTTSAPCNSDDDCAFGNTCDPPDYYLINNTLSLANKISIDHNMALEAIKVYAEAISESANAKIILHYDQDDSPGEEIFSWDIDVVQLNHNNNYFLIITTDECIYLDKDNYYWISVNATDSESEIAWYFSNNPSFTYSINYNQESEWENSSYGHCGSMSVWSEYIYEQEVNEDVPGDINLDGSLNVLDVVILANIVISGDDYNLEGDTNNDGVNNVLDVVALVNTIITGANPNQLPTWDYIDINPNSQYFNQLIGPETFTNHVSLYYFGKAG